MSDTDKKPLSGAELSKLYTNRLSYDETLARDAAYERRRDANRPKFPAFRLSAMLSGIILAGLVAVQLANRISPFDLRGATASALPVLISTSVLFSAMLIIIYGGYSTYRYAEKLSNYRDKDHRPYAAIYLILVCVVLTSLFAFEIISFERVLWMSISENAIVITAHFVIAYLLFGKCVDYGRH